MTQSDKPVAGRTTSWRTGLDHLIAATPLLEDLHRATGTPVTARTEWVHSWALAHPTYRPLLVVVQSTGVDTVLQAAAGLGLHRRGSFTDVVALGHTFSDHVRLPSRDHDAARLLASGIGDALAAINGPWRLSLAGLPEADPVVAHLVEILPHVEVSDRPGHGRPVLDLDRGPDLAAYRSKTFRKSLRRRERRLAEQGPVTIEVLHEHDGIVAVLPRLAALRRLRDVEQGRRNVLDTDAGRVFWPAVMDRLSDAGLVEVILVHCGSDLIAFTVGLCDGDTYRVWDGRMDPSWAVFGPGALVDTVALRRALAGGFAAFDLMAGESDFKMRLANRVEPCVTLRAWSSRTVRAVDDAYGSVWAWARERKEDSAALERVWSALKQAAAGTGRQRC